MRILYIDWNMYGKLDIIEAFETLENEVLVTDIPVSYEGDNSLIAQKLDAYISDAAVDAVCTSNYYPLVSNICDKYGVKYIAWVYDSPLISLYDKSIVNACNYVFIFDSSECE